MSNGTNRWDAKDYAKNSSAQLTWANELIDKLGLQGDEHLLDIGCGDGKITHAIAQKLPKGRVVGFDRSKSMIDLANETFQQPNLSFHVMDATAIDLPHKFNVAFSTAVLHWVADHVAFLTSLKRHLTPDAKVLLQMGGVGNARAIEEAIEQVITTDAWKPYFKGFESPYNFCSMLDYAQWLAATGYKAQRVELINKDMVHQDTEGLKGWLRTTWFPYTDRLPEDHKEAFLNQVIDCYISTHPVDGKGKTHVGMVRLEVEATPA